MNRRTFLADAGKASLLLSGLPNLTFGESHREKIQVEAITSGPKHHFFGYYDINPWNASRSHLLCLEAGFPDRNPQVGEKAQIGLVDPRTRKFEKITETSAWNFQQGTMLHWDPLNPDRIIYFNDVVDGAVVTRKVDIHSGKESAIPYPINGLSHHGKYSLSLHYGRLGRMRPDVAYSGTADPNPDIPAPQDDGIFLVDMETAKAKLIVSFHQVYEMLKDRGVKMESRHIWFNHVVFNPSDKRFFFLARTPHPTGKGKETGMFTANLDGSNLFEAIPYGTNVSHFDWRTDKEILATMQLQGDVDKKHYMFEDGSHDFIAIGEGRLDFDGHCAFGPDRKWLATDQRRNSEGSYRQLLYLYNVTTKELITVADHDMMRKEYAGGLIRCDFHPRWRNDGKQICFDSIDQRDGTRQMHLASWS